jgi:hypothetical protein
MPHCRFKDSRGVTWEVWDVKPSRAERRQEPSPGDAPYRGPERRRTSEPKPRVRLSGEYAEGWLAFESPAEKRRLVPVPEAWDRLDDAGLEALLDQAAVVTRPPRLIE